MPRALRRRRSRIKLGGRSMGNSFAGQLVAALENSWPVIARPNQLPPPGDWSIWLLLAGRGFGKTRTLADRELPRRCLDRCAGRQKPFNPHALEVIASLTAPCPGTLPSRHWLSPRPRLIKKTRAPCQHKNLFLEDFTSTAQNYGAVMAVSDLGVYLSEYG